MPDIPAEETNLLEAVRSLCRSMEENRSEAAWTGQARATLDQVLNALEEATRRRERLEGEIERLHRQEQTFVETIRYTREELEQKIEEISLVRLVAETGIRSLLSDNPLQFILNQVNQLTGAEHGSIMLLDTEQGRLYLAASSGPDQIPPYERSYRLGEGIARWVDRSLSNVEPPLDPTDVEALRDSDSKHGSFLCYPLIVEHTLVGVLSIGHEQPETFTDNTERVLYIIANQVAMAVYNSHLLSMHEKQKTYLQRSHERYRSLVERVNDLLDLARLETGNLQFEKGALRIREILTSLRPKYKPDLRRKNIRMQVHIPKRIPTIEGDATRLSQALCILLEDSIRATPEHGFIRLDVSIEAVDKKRWPQVDPPPGVEKFLLFALTDSAPSVPQQLQGSIFEKLKDESLPSGPARGVSLSLFLAKEIIESHEGQVWLESGEAEGNTYFFSLPIS